MILRTSIVRIYSSVARRSILSNTYASASDSSTSTSKKNNPLIKLRKKTGYSFKNIKKALQKFSNDVKEAEKWLNEQAEKEGWAKATKLRGRDAKQGLIAIISEKHLGVMVELNCETDFVAKNEKFDHFVSQITAAIYNKYKKQKQQDETTICTKINIPGEEMGKMEVDDSKMTLSGLVAATVGKIGENVVVRRAVCLASSQGAQIGSYVHSGKNQKDKTCLTGTYGSLVCYRKMEGVSVAKFNMAEVGRRLSMHVVGMRPLTIGTWEPPAEEEAEEEVEDSSSSSSSEESSEEEPSDETLSDGEEEVAEKEETEMLKQELLDDTSMTVGEFLHVHGLEVLDFVRFECGEKLEEVDQS